MPSFTHPTALADQIEAAEAHLERILHHAAPELGMTFHDETPTGWLAERISAFAADLLGGRLECCEHLTSGGPAPRSPPWPPPDWSSASSAPSAWSETPKPNCPATAAATTAPKRSSPPPTSEPSSCSSSNATTAPN